MPTDTFTCGDNDDGGGIHSSASYPPSGFTANGDGTTIEIVRQLTGATYHVANGLFRFDTSTIDDSATVTAAVLKVYVVSVDMDGTGYQLIADYYDFGGEATVAGDITSSDTGNIITSVGLLSLTASAVNNLTITDLSGINKTGHTGIRLKLNQDTAPTADNNYVVIASSEDAVNPAPQLEVTYTVPSGASMITVLGVG